MCQKSLHEVSKVATEAKVPNKLYKALERVENRAKIEQENVRKTEAKALKKAGLSPKNKSQDKEKS